ARSCNDRSGQPEKKNHVRVDDSFLNSGFPLSQPGDRMRRRKLVAGLGGAVAAWPFAAWAQQPRMPVIGLLDGTTLLADRYAAVRRGLQEAGFVEGRNLAIESLTADGRYERLPALAADLVRRQVAVIIGRRSPSGCCRRGNPLVSLEPWCTCSWPRRAHDSPQ